MSGIRNAAIAGFGAILFLFAACRTEAPPGSGGDTAPPWLGGYAKTLSGEILAYHSPYPGHIPALLTRATDGTMAIEWETDPVPRGFRGESATFVWMAGLVTGDGTRRFDLVLDGTPALAFTSVEDISRREWRVSGARGVNLSFRATMADQFDDLFGFMWLEVPRSLLRPGRALRLKVTGENAGSRDWFMVFEKRMENEVAARSDQVLVLGDGRLEQVIRVEVGHVAPPAEAVISLGRDRRIRARLETGYNSVGFPVPAVTADQTVEIEVAVPGREPGRAAVTVKPVLEREIWLLPHSHVDIGYSDPQPVVERKQWGYFEEAIRLAEKTAAYPEGARFKWNVEQLWAVETYLRQAGEAGRARFFDAVRKGQIGLQAWLAGVLTGICHPEELFHLTAFARRLAEATGLPVDSAMVTDIPSQSWSVVPALALAGVRYLSSGPNYMPSLPDGGDRIGASLKTWGDKPFYWISPSGSERILFWMAGRGYSWFHGLHLGDISRTPPERIFDYLDDLVDDGYPYSMVQVRYTIGGDNGPPDPDLPDFVRAWNDRYFSPRMVIATTSEMFEEFERRHGDAVPTVRGDFTPHWEDGAASSAFETALNRRSAERLVQAGALWAALDPEAFPANAYDEAWRRVVLFSEHTWGSADSVSDPDGENSRGQWAYKKAFAEDADSISRDIMENGRLSREPGEADPGRAAFDVFNTSSWPRTDIAVIPADMVRPGNLVTDDRSDPVPSQRLRNGDLAFTASSVPALGAKRYWIIAGRAAATGTDVVGGTILDNGRITLVADPDSGAIRSVLWKAGRNRELVDRGPWPGLAHYLYVPGRSPAAAVGVSNVTIKPGESGPVVSSLIVESDAPGARSLVREYRIIRGLDRVEISVRLDKKKVRNKESVHLAFPFRVPGGTVRVDAGWGTVRPGEDQIAGANMDFFSVQKSVDVSNSDFGVTWTSLDVPLAEIGEMTDESPNRSGTRSWRRTVEPTGLIFSYAMNNYWHTNFKADQEGPVRMDYAVAPHGGFDPAEVKRISFEAAQPFITLPAEEGSPVPVFPLEFEPDDVLVVSLKPAPDGKGWIARLFNAGDGAASLVFKGKFGDEGAVYRSTPIEGRGERISGPATVPGSGIVTLYLARNPD
jgi:alpha-mannosidase